jgi:predicted amidohydrolase YtcJ
MRVDSIWRNGRFWTGTGERPEAHALAVLHGRIVAVDDLEGLEADEVHDLDGARVVPGLHDAHHHLSLTGHRLGMVDLKGLTELEELYSRLAARAAELGPDEWVKATYYDQNLMHGEHPSAEGIDAVVGGRPAIVEHVSGHMIVANTRAMELAGFADRRHPDIDGGRVFRDADGRATGLLQERAANPVREASSNVSKAEILEALERASEQAVSYGLTSLTEPGVVASGTLTTRCADVDAYQTAVATGRIKPRMTIMPFHTALHPLDAPAGWQSLDWGIRTGLGDDRLRIGPVKIVSDGSLIGRSAAVHQCYCGEPENVGVMQLSGEELRAALISYHRAGWAVATHAIGDRAIDHVLDAVEEAQRLEPRRVRHRIEHFAIASDEQVARCADLGVIPVPQGVFISDFGDGILEAIGPERSAGTYRMRSLLDAGMVVPGSTDSPVSDANPFVSMHDLVNRKTRSGADFAPAERVSIEEALHAYTVGSAHAVGREDAVGTLAAGRLADFVVLSEDLLQVPSERIREVQAVRTVVGGEAVFSR